jgi:hypothetical protein
MRAVLPQMDHVPFAPTATGLQEDTLLYQVLQIACNNRFGAPMIAMYFLALMLPSKPLIQKTGAGCFSDACSGGMWFQNGTA